MDYEKLERILNNLIRSELLDAIGDIIVLLALLLLIGFVLYMVKWCHESKLLIEKQKEEKDE